MDYQALLLNLCELFVMDDVGMDDDVLIEWIMNMGEPSIYNIHSMKDRGNSLFKVENFSSAFSLYKHALQLLCFLDIPSTHDQQAATSLALSLVLNLAVCELKLSHYNQAWCYCNLVLKFDPSNVKAFYRRGLAFQKLNLLVEALDDFEHALKLDPKNKDVSRELHYVVDCLALKPNRKRAACHFDPLGKDKKGKKPLLEVVADTKFQPLDEVCEASCSRGPLLINEMDCDSNTSSRSSDVVMESDSNAKTCPPSFGHSVSQPSAANSTRYSFSNKKQSYKNLSLSSKDYENLILGKNLQFYHPKSGAYMKVRPISSKPKPSILTGTPHEKSSWEAVVPSSSPLPVNLCPTMGFTPTEDLEIFVEKAVSHQDIKRPRLSHMESPSNNNTVEMDMLDSTLTKHSVMDDSSPLPSPNHFVFSALKQTKQTAGSRCSISRQSGNQPSDSHRMSRDQADIKNKSLKLVRGFLFCRFTKTLEVAVSYKRKHECSIHFDSLYHSPPKKRRLCATGSFCTSTYASCFSTSLGVCLAPRFVL